MKPNELESLIEGQKEHPGLDFKGPCAWDVKKLARDILAMSNLADGGYIVIGVEENGNSFERKGVGECDCRTYKVDNMRDQVSKYADPMVDFDLHFFEDLNGLTYVVIKIYSFKETPTICKRDSEDLRAGTIYYRNTNRRVESAAISNVNDLRDIIELAAVRMMKRRRSFGFVVPDDDKQLYQAEVDAVNNLPLVKKIKTKGYCEVSVTPLVKNNLQNLGRCLSVVEKSQVRLAWVFPVIPTHAGEGNVDTAENCFQGTSDLGSRKEVWRMYLSEHFYILNAFVDDWMEGDFLRGHMAGKFPSGKFFFFYTSLLHYITQLYVFIERLAMQGLYKKGVRVSISFNNTAGRELFLDDGQSSPLIRKRITKANVISFEEEYSQNQLLEESTKLANIIISRVSEYFQFTPPSDSIQVEQLNFLNGK